MSKPKNMVVDTSVMVKWLNRNNEKYVENADKLLEDVQNEKANLLAPELARYEVGNALLNKRMATAPTLGSIATYYSIPINFIPQSKELAIETYKIAESEKITYYDASFVALAKQQNSSLVTDNIKHQNVKEIKIIPLSNYK